MIEPVAVNIKDLAARLWIYKPTHFSSLSDTLRRIYESIPKHSTLRDIVAVVTSDYLVDFIVIINGKPDRRNEELQPVLALFQLLLSKRHSQPAKVQSIADVSVIRYYG